MDKNDLLGTYYFRLIIYSSTMLDRKIGREVKATDSYSARRQLVDEFLSQGIFIRRIW